MKDDIIVFAGDSVTDCGRREDPEGLGFGYVRSLGVSPSFAGRRVINAGTGGDRLADLAARWQRDVVDLTPSVVSILIGVNDTWRHFDSGEPSDPEAFESGYRSLLGRLVGAPRLVLLEPFVVPVNAEQATWRQDIESRIDVVQRLADEFGADLVPTDELLNAHAVQVGPEAIAADGVHPTDLGHQLIAAAWSERVHW